MMMECGLGVVLMLLVVGRVGSVEGRPAHDLAGTVFVANRGSGTVSVVDPVTLTKVDEVTLPDSGEPMYVATSHRGDIWVGDRNNSRIVIYKPVGRKIVYDGSVPARAGVFHSMIAPNSSDPYPIAWCTCDEDKVTLVFDVTTRRLLATIRTPRCLKRMGAYPHDVTSNGRYGFVTYIGAVDGYGYVIAYDALNEFKKVKVFRTAADPHVGVREDSNLMIAAQGGKVRIVEIPTFKIAGKDNQTSPHGIVVNEGLKYGYVTNIADDGVNAVVAYDVRTGDRLNCPEVNTSIPGPHNLKTSLIDDRLFITHSSANMNTAFDVGPDGCVDPMSESKFPTGMVPFGLCVMPRAPEVSQGACFSSGLAAWDT